jgi:hypothetical protein
MKYTCDVRCKRVSAQCGGEQCTRRTPSLLVMYLVLDARAQSNYRPISRVQRGVDLKRETREDREELKGLDMSVGTREVECQPVNRPKVEFQTE